MKKVFFSAVTIAALTLASCGGVDACECGETAAKGEKADKDLAKKCKEHADGLKDDEQKKFLEDAAKCMKSDKGE